MKYLLDTLVSHPIYFTLFIVPIAFFSYSFVWSIGKYKNEQNDQKKQGFKFGIIANSLMSILLIVLFVSFSFFKWNSSWSGEILELSTSGGRSERNLNESTTEFYHIKLSTGQTKWINRKIYETVSVGDSIVKIDNSYIIILNGEELRQKL